jgi:hypothetical protein
LKRDRSSATSLATTGSNTKRMRGSAYENAASKAAEGMALLGQSIKEAQLIPNPPPQTRLDQCLDILNDMKNQGTIMKNEYFGICSKLMENDRYAVMFYGISEDFRLEWLLSELVHRDGEEH